MAKKELLFFLIWLISFNQTYASNVQTLQEAEEMREQSIKLSRKAIIARFKKLRIEQGREEEIESTLNPKPEVRVFVSSSMPISLLKQYCTEANRYEACLVFNGLPNNSFKELAKLVQEMTEDERECSMQIDNESFEKYGITEVPSFVMAKNADCVISENCSPKIYDKVIGNIGIKGALEKFSSDGDWQEIAKELLSNRND